MLLRVMMISGQRKLFHAPVNVNTVSVISAGCTSGSTIVTKVRTSPLPSISAASISSLGTACINCRIRNMPNAPTMGRMSAEYVLDIPTRLTSTNIEISTTWPGTIMVAR